MNRMIVSVFETEEKAFEGLSALKTLHKSGDISLYASAVINKNEKGEVSTKSIDDQGPIGTSIGLLTGAFVGTLAGPAGMAVGAMVGSMGGMFYDVRKTGLDSSFIDEVSQALKEGKTAVLADVEEGWMAPVDTRLDALDAMIFRRNRAELEDEHMKREVDVLKSEIDELKIELKDANEDMKESIQKQIDTAQKKGKAMQELIDNKLKTAKEENEAKLEKVSNQLKDANLLTKKKLEKRKEKLEVNYDRQKENLSVAAKKVSEYLT